MEENHQCKPDMLKCRQPEEKSPVMVRVALPLQLVGLPRKKLILPVLFMHDRDTEPVTSPQVKLEHLPGTALKPGWPRHFPLMLASGCAALVMLLKMAADTGGHVME